MSYNILVIGDITMEGYEKTIGLKTIWLTIVRRFEYILFIFIPIALTTFIVTRFVLTKTYQSTVTVSLNKTFSAADFSVFQTYVTNSDVLDATVSKLNEQGLTLKSSDITTGLSFKAPASSAISGSFSYTSSNKAIVQPVMEALSEASVSYAKEKDNSKFASLNISTPATAAVKNSSENKYLLIGLAAGLVVACAIPFIDEIISDEVYDVKDVQQLGCEGFELNVSKLNKKMVDGEKYGSSKI